MERISSEGISILNFVGSPITTEDCFKAEELLKMNYGVEYPAEKFSMLWEMIIEDHWTSERLSYTLKWFLKNKKFPNWTIADWFDFSVKLFPPKWYAEQIFKGHKHEEMEAYRINGKAYWKFADGIELPFEKIV